MQKQFVILADVTCDLSPEIRAEIGMEDYLKGHIHFDDGRDFYTTLEWDNISREEFYKILSSKNRKVTTAPPSQEEYYEAFKSYVQKGYSVLSMSLSSALSSTYSFACTSAERVRAEIPEAEIYCFDSYRMSGAFGLQVIYAHLLKNEGKSFEEVIAWLEENKYCVHQMGPIDDLIFVARRGRLTMGKAIMGSFAGVKPMGDCNATGYTTVLTKTKGINSAFDITAKYVQAMATDPQNQVMLIAHSNREAYAELLRQKLAETVKPAKLLVTDVYNACGTNIGPGMIGVYFLGGKIAEDMEAEKEAMKQIVGK